ncbi:MAG: hypothetical protein JXQ82_08730 [Methanomicrobiaceae archaeon]|nr:hypothetical protein [Methanomicrobiaceae archaeon]
MRAYYALVDDILEWDEFEEAVYSINACPDSEESENNAAAAIAERYGRLHPKISKLSPKPTLNSFFCRVIEKEPVREFIRDDKSPGLVARILVGDETGEAILVFWDEKAYATEEINCGDLLEVAGRVKSLSNVIVVDLRKTENRVTLREGGIRSLNPCSLTLLIIDISENEEYKRKDGSSAFRKIIFGYGKKGFLKITVWNPGLAEGLAPGITVNAGFVIPRPSYSEEYNTGEKTCFETADEVIRPEYSKISDLNPGERCSISGTLEDVGPVLGYFREDGDLLWLKKGTLYDDTGKIPFVLWGKNAKTPLFKGDGITIFNCLVKKSDLKNDFINNPVSVSEVHAGYNSCIKLSERDSGEGEDIFISRTGVVAKLCDGTYLLCEDERFLLAGADIKPGSAAEVSGVLKKHTIYVESFSPVVCDIKSLNTRISLLKQRFSKK